MLDTANVAAKVEKLLAELHAAAPVSADHTDSDKEHTRARLLERIAAEVRESPDTSTGGIRRQQRRRANRDTVSTALEQLNLRIGTQRAPTALTESSPRARPSSALAPQRSTTAAPHRPHPRARERTQVNRLKFYLAHGSELPLVQGMTPRIKASQALLAVALRECLARALTRDDSPVALRCLLAYAAMDDVAAAEAVVRDVAVAPAVQKVLAAA